MDFEQVNADWVLFFVSRKSQTLSHQSNFAIDKIRNSYYLWNIFFLPTMLCVNHQKIKFNLNTCSVPEETQFTSVRLSFLLSHGKGSACTTSLWHPLLGPLSLRKRVLRNYARPATLLKKRIWHRCFSVTSQRVCYFLHITINSWLSSILFDFADILILRNIKNLSKSCFSSL